MGGPMGRGGAERLALSGERLGVGLGEKENE